MASNAAKNVDFYAVLGLNQNCSDLELKNAYKKLAMRWHPDKCSSSGNENVVKEAKEKFQEIQKAYSVLSDSNKRFLYDVGVYDNNDDNDEFGMGDFLGEMAQMINQTNTNDNGGQESFEELQRLFVEMFQDDIDSGSGSFGFCGAHSTVDRHRATDCSSSSSRFGFGSGNKRGSSGVGNSGKSKLDGFSSPAISTKFCFGLNDKGQSSSKGRDSSSKRRDGRKQKTSCKHDVSSNDNAELSI